MEHDNKQPSRSNSADTMAFDAASTTSTVFSSTSHSDEKASQLPEKNGTAPLNIPVTKEESGEKGRQQRVITLPLSDPDHPNNWSFRKKSLVLLAGILTVIHSTLGSSLPSNAVNFITETFNVTSQIQLVLPISCFLMGYVLAPTLFGPLSENYGRKPVMLISFIFFILWTMACALAPSWASFLFFRFMCGAMASAPIACVSGIFADINSDPRVRGRTMALFMASTTVGPIAAAPLSGFVAQNTSWRWVFGVGTLFALSTLPFLVFMPETYAPVLLRQRAAKMRRETGDDSIIAQSDLQERSLKFVFTVVLARPYRMLFQEMIVACSCVYLSLCYGIFYLSFSLYPVIFEGPNSVYGWSPGLAGLALIPIGIGAVICGGLFMWWDVFLARAQDRKESWSQIEEYRRLPLACIGGPIWVVSLFWIGWTARSDVHWLVPVSSGIFFGIGFMLIFMALLNYLSDAYMTFAASAQGVASTCRSLVGVLLPLSAHSMFSRLGIAWSCTLLAFLSMIVATIPFFFIKYGDKLRTNSKFCQELRTLHEKELEEARQTQVNSNEIV